MYAVSNDFKARIKLPSQKHSISGTIGAVSFTSDNILRGSLSITNQCSDNNDITLGSVYIGELKATFVNVEISRYTWQKLDIKPYFSIEGATDRIPLGVFTISEANWTVSGIEITAYDYMSRFEKSRNRWPDSDTLLNYVKLACTACKVTLGMTDAEFQALPNGTGEFELSTDNCDIATYRDLLSWVAQTTATFATIDRQGRLIFKAFTQTVVDTVDDESRYTGAKFSDYSTRYTGMSVVDVESKKTVYYHVDPDDALVMNLGTNPFLQFGSDINKATYRQRILNAIASGINYVPMEVSMAGSPAYDLGDVIIFTNGLADSTKKSCITKYTWNFGRAYSISGAGQNPALVNGKSKTDHNLEGLMSEQERLSSLVGESANNYFDYSSSTDVAIADNGTVEVARISYEAGSLTRCELRGEIQLAVATTEETSQDGTTYTENDAVVTAICTDNGSVVGYFPQEAYFDGNNMMHLCYVWTAPQIPSEDARIFRVFLQSMGGALTVGRRHVYITTWGGVEYEPNPVAYIEVMGQPEWDVYPGDLLDYGAVVVGAVMEDGTEIDVSLDCTFYPAEGSVIPDTDEVEVTVMYDCEDGRFEDTFTIPVQEPYVTGVAVTSLPTKSTYSAGEQLNYTGLVVTATYNNGTTADVTADCEIEPEAGEYVYMTCDAKTTVAITYDDGS